MYVCLCATESVYIKLLAQKEKEIHVAHMCTTWLWQKTSDCETPLSPHGYKESAADVSPTLATALIKALMIGFQLRSKLSSHIIAPRQLALAELQPSALLKI